jgi:hypothetical protein
MASVQGIAAYASNLSAAQLHQQVGVAVARKSLDAMEAQGQAAVSLLEEAASLQDQMVAAASPLPHIGKTLDTFA